MPIPRLRRFAAAFALSAFATAAHAADKVTFAWPGVMSSGYGPIAFAQELGFFQDENIEVDTVLLQGASTIIPQLMNGTVFTAFITLNPLIVARQPGNPNFDLRYVYDVVPKSIWELTVLKDSKIGSVKDLAGKTVGVGLLSGGEVPMTKAILKHEGVDPNSVQFIQVGMGVPALDALKRGKVDALNLFDVLNAGMELQGLAIRRLPLPAEFQHLSSYGFPVTTKMIAEHPDLIARFGRAFAKGSVACQANLEGCLAAYWKHEPDQKPAVLDDEAMTRAVKVLKVRLDNMEIPQTGPTRLGAFSDADWTRTAEYLAEGGQIADPNVKLDTLYTNRFVPEYNRFDIADVIAKAKAYGAPK